MDCARRHAAVVTTAAQETAVAISRAKAKGAGRRIEEEAKGSTWACQPAARLPPGVLTVQVPAAMLPVAATEPAAEMAAA